MGGVTLCCLEEESRRSGRCARGGARQDKSNAEKGRDVRVNEDVQRKV